MEEYIKTKNNKKLYKSLVEDLISAGDLSKRHPNNHVMLIDGMNLFLRNFNLNPSVNDNGEHVGGMIGFLRSLGSLNKQFSPTRVIVVFDGKKANDKRREIQEGYKGERNLMSTLNRIHDFETEADVKERLEYQLKRLPAYLLYFPVQLAVKEKYEADDLIYKIAEIMSEDSNCDKITVVSSDKDFLQMTSNHKIQIWRPMEKKLYDYKNKFKKFDGILPENLPLFRSFLGDASDSISNIKGIGPKILLKLFPEFKEKQLDINYIKQKASESYTKNNKMKIILENIKTLESNMKITDLSLVDFSNYTLRYLQDVCFNSQIDLLNKTKIKELLIYDNSNDVIKNIDNWFMEAWTNLNYYAKKHNEKFNKTEHDF